MKIYVSASVSDSGKGTLENPFKTIGEAARVAVPGDEVIVKPGVYREYVDPINGGTANNRIIYRSEKKGEAIITGAEPIDNWKQYKGNTWMVSVPNSIFKNYNPYTTIVEGDWYYSPVHVHTGEVYLNGKAMYEVFCLKDVLEPKILSTSWEKKDSLYKWYTEQEDSNTVIYANFQGRNPNHDNIEINVRRNCFYPSKEGVGYITLSGFVIKQAATQWAPPTAYQDGMVGPHWSKGWIIEDCEISHSKCCGITLGKYLQPNNNNKWTTEYVKDGTQTERECIMQAWFEGWDKEHIGSHIVRRCNIHHCGQTGIVGHLGGVFSLIEENHIHHINNKQDLAGAEIAGIKLHAAIDVIIRRNHINNCTRGIWLDWQAQGTRVACNLLHDNNPPEDIEIAPPLGLGEDIFIEVSHGPTLIDNNVLLSACSCRISAQGLAFVHNLFAGSFTYVGAGTDNKGVKFPTPRYTPYHMHHNTAVAGFMTILHGDVRFYNNVFIQKEMPESYRKYVRQRAVEKEYNFIVGTKPYNGYPDAVSYFSRFGPWNPENDANKDRYYDHLPVYAEGNAYFNGAVPWDKESDAYVDREHQIVLTVAGEEECMRLKTNLYKYLPDITKDIITTETLGKAFEPEQYFENADGSEIIFNTDYFGGQRSKKPVCGPFEGESQSQRNLI